MLNPVQLVGVCDVSGFVLGSDVTLKVQVIDKITNQPAQNASGTTAASAQFGNADGTTLTRTLATGISLVDSTEALFAVSLTAAQTALLQAGAAQSWQFAFVGGDGATTWVVFDQTLELVPRVF